MRRRTKIFLGVVVAVGAAVFFWPTSRDQAGYPFTRRLLGEQSRPLWQLSAGELRRALVEDTARLEQAVGRLDAAVANARANRALLATEDVETLRAEQRAAIRQIWWSFIDPLLATDRMKHRYQDWYGIDYLRNPELHAMAYALNFAALCAQVSAGQELLSLVADNRRVQALMDEAMPDLGVPSGTFLAVRARLSRVRDQSLVPVGARWHHDWIEAHLAGPDVAELRGLVERERTEALRWVSAEAAANAARNDSDIVRDVLFEAWLPVQTHVAEWFGDTRVVPADRRLIGDADLERLAERIRPGDIIVERRNWYLSNVGLPGFWPHAALFVGSQDQIRAAFDEDPEVRERFGTFSEHLATTYPAAWAAFEDAVVLEAISEGVVAATLEHSCGADYVAVMRPRASPVDVAASIDRAFRFFGRPYDFDFDFGTDDEVVCSELVVKAYEGVLTVPAITVAGRRAIPPTEIVRVFAQEIDREDRQLDFVYFLDGLEGPGQAVPRNAQALAQSVDRPKWDILQP